MHDNIAYQTDKLVSYFKENRISWPQFYESERMIISQLKLDGHHRILDIGCGCGGLGLALQSQFGVVDYTGVEINTSSAEVGREMNPNARILCGDILDLSRGSLCDKCFDVVFSLSCVDWNVQFEDMLVAAWKHVFPGGYLVATFRLTTEEGCNDISKSYQFINYDGALEGERASYVVLNIKTLMQQLIHFDPSEVSAYGYWGVPSVTAMTPYKKLCFAAFSIRKRKPDEVAILRSQMHLPTEILNTMEIRA